MKVLRHFAMNFIPPCVNCGGEFVLTNEGQVSNVQPSESRIKSDVDRGIRELEQFLAKKTEQGGL